MDEIKPQCQRAQRWLPTPAVIFASLLAVGPVCNLSCTSKEKAEPGPTGTKAEEVRAQVAQSCAQYSRLAKEDPEDGYSALHHAALDGNLRCARVFVAQGVPVDALSAEGQTALMLVPNGVGTPELAKFLVAKGADVKARDQDGASTVYWAAGNKNPAFVQLLIENGAEANTATKTGETPLHRAALVGNATVVQYLLKIGADAKAEVVSRTGERLTPGDLTTDPKVKELLVDAEVTAP
jgi:ankyrin repeat protein